MKPAAIRLKASEKPFAVMPGGRIFVKVTNRRLESSWPEPMDSLIQFCELLSFRDCFNDQAKSFM